MVNNDRLNWETKYMTDPMSFVSKKAQSFKPAVK